MAVWMIGFNALKRTDRTKGGVRVGILEGDG
jgi:hypothetical protein